MHKIILMVPAAQAPHLNDNLKILARMGNMNCAAAGVAQPNQLVGHYVGHYVGQ
jgi:hypothetical protein